MGHDKPEATSVRPEPLRVKPPAKELDRFLSASGFA